MRAKILNASAGSGKTYQLAYKYVRDVVEQPAIYRHILAVTFTNKATEEMKSRILKEIHLLASGAESSYLKNLCDELGLDAATVRKRAREVRSKILHDYSRFTVLTIDTFFQRILRAFIKELGIDLNYNVEIETASVLTKSADTLIEQITTDHDLQRWLTDFVQERIDEGKKWDIRDGILSLGGELFKEKNKDALAVARSREELGRIVAEATAHAAETKKHMQDTASNAVQIIARAGASAEDFPYKRSGFAAWFYAVAEGRFEPYGSRAATACEKDEAWGKPGTSSQGLRPQLQPMLREMCDLYDTNIRSWNTCELLRENYRSFALLSDLYAKVQQMCDEQNMMLLSETKYILSEFIGHNDAPFIYEKVGNRFEHFMIDEFQDTSVKEWENFMPLLQNAMSQSEATSVLIVGDIKQSIYRWRGGDWKILHAGAQQSLGAESTEVVNLKENWRSLPVVVDFNNKIIGRVVEADNRALNELLDKAALQGDITQDVAKPLLDTLSDAYHEHVQEPRRRCDRAGYVSVSTFAEQPPVVERIREILDKGFRPCDIMILVRGATDGAKVAAELLDFKRRNTDARYRFDVMTQEALIVGNAPVSSFVAAAMRLSLNPDDSLNRAVYNHYLGQEFDRQLTPDERTFFRSIRLLSPEEAFERIVMRHDLQHDRRQTAYLQAVHEQIIGFSASKIADISLYLDWWEETGKNRSLSIEQSERTVEITTIHKAKGLEKRVVLIPHCSWPLDPKSGGNVTNIVWAEAQGEAGAVGRFPVKYKKSMGESGFSAEYYRELVYSHVDNVNLLYVALTRAAESLHVFIPQKGGRTVGGLLLQSILTDGDKALLGTTQGRYTVTETGERFEFGEFTGPASGGGKASRSEHIVLEEYPTATADLRLRLPSQRYFEEEDEVELSPRNFGILMHKAFENAEDQEQIRGAVEQMQADGTLSAAEAETLWQMIRRALENPMVREWFGGEWEQVRNENEIIIPHSSSTRRPDRVMIRDGQVVVVDYKFGEREAERNRRQMREYLGLIRQMGYTRCEGYLWYVKLGNIEKVEEDERSDKHHTA
ncbi:exodeoxyribonuclease V subunit beta [uncultured Alistipes sp.]|uniref:UvrD-helicase domain-containing protein n=1 Tax=uncultured Alistipes sp. TaxID=538949 RepID=UPI0025F7B8CF|nr:UvrD-helicase domain-containing protein [uncultured Alistipes sp.]